MAMKPYQIPGLALRSRHYPAPLLPCFREKTGRSGRESWFPGLWRLAKTGYFYSRNSYRYRKYHIYETVKLNQIEHKFNYSESEKTFKAFIEHGLD